jgi:hypothetical protein
MVDDDAAEPVSSRSTLTHTIQTLFSLSLFSSSSISMSTSLPSSTSSSSSSNKRPRLDIDISSPRVLAAVVSRVSTESSSSQKKQPSVKKVACHFKSALARKAFANSVSNRRFWAQLDPVKTTPPPSPTSPVKKRKRDEESKQ